MNEQSDNSVQPARPGTAGAADDQWQVRIGQIETVLQFFGALCSVEVENVYVQAQRVAGGLELEMTGPQYLVGHDLTDDHVALMLALGWTGPDGTAAPNFSRFVADDVDLHDVAVGVARAFGDVYSVGPDDVWVVSPPEFGNVDAGLAPLDITDLDGEDEAVCPAEELMVARRRILREASGAQLLAVVESAAVTWDDLVEAGLPRDDKRAELVMLYRPDCPVEFLRGSSFHLDVLADPALPTSTVQSVLTAEPTAYEINKLAKRADVPRSDLARAASLGAKLANWRGRSGASFLRLSVVPTRRLRELAAIQDEDAAGMLRHPRCPEEVVLKHVLSRSAQVRYLALLATKRRGLAIDSALIRLAETVPMTERPDTHFPYADRARALADAILEAR